MKLLTQLIRIITGLLFIFSGFVKGVDPLGTAYKLNDYFDAFNIGFLSDLSLAASIVLCTVEFAAGMMLLTGGITKIASWAVALFMAVFTPLTLILALFNPVSDCGCFGDAIHLTNWQTFFKNIILTLLVVFVFIRKDDITFTLGRKKSAITAISTVVVFTVFIFYNLAYLPVIDFRPYKPGTNLPEAMTIPQDAATDKYDIRFIYEKEGVKKEFTLNDYPADDTTWKFVDQKSVLLSKGYVPPVHDFSLVTADGMDMTGPILDDPGYTMLMISGKTEKANKKYFMKGLELGALLQAKGFGFYLLTSSLPSGAEISATQNNTLFADETTLKTVVRSNPGFVLLSKGTVLAMWSGRGLPEPGLLTADPLATASMEQRHRNTVLMIFAALLSVIFLTSLVFRLKKSDN